MTQGSKTPWNKELEFREAYLRLGNQRAAAREVGLPGPTGHVLACRARSDPEFRKALADMATSAYDDAKRAVIDCLAVAEELANSDGYTPEQLAEIADANGLKSLNWQDSRPAYIAQVNRAYDLLAREKARLESEVGGIEGVSVHVHLAKKAGEQDQDEPDDEAG